MGRTSSLVSAMEHLSSPASIQGARVYGLEEKTFLATALLYSDQAQRLSWVSSSRSSAVMVADATLDMPARSIVAPSLPSGGS